MGWKKRLSLFLLFCLPFISIGQASNFGCETGTPGTSTYVPTFPIDLSASPSAIDTLDIDIPPGGFGECCGESNNINCFVMEITLNSLAAGISFQLDGASGNADIWYEDCTNGGQGHHQVLVMFSAYQELDLIISPFVDQVLQITGLLYNLYLHQEVQGILRLQKAVLIHWLFLDWTYQL